MSYKYIRQDNQLSIQVLNKNLSLLCQTRAKNAGPPMEAARHSSLIRSLKSSFLLTLCVGQRLRAALIK